MSALATIDPDTGGLALSFSGQRQVLHPLWLRERVNGENVFDPISHQRLYEHSELPDDLVVSQINDTTADAIKLTFNSGETLSLSLQDTLQELGWAPHAEALPSPKVGMPL
ncbi:hypothetical protein AB8615_00545 [Litorimonas sp. RW-G-Af-16]|uniref:hypothetical protein n=1 Tax=Litorimonas sp. RW-G-Af-16 TaxID=3241168 RepID=UPI003AAC97BC